MTKALLILLSLIIPFTSLNAQKYCDIKATQSKEIKLWLELKSNNVNVRLFAADKLACFSNNLTQVATEILKLFKDSQK